MADNIAMGPEGDRLVLKHFRATLRGGTSSFSRTGRWDDCWQAQVERDSEAADCCKLHTLQQTKVFSLKELGDGPANIMRNERTRRMQQLFDSHKAGGFSSPARAGRTLGGIHASAEFVVVIANGSTPVKHMGLWIRSLAPRV